MTQVILVEAPTLIQSIIQPSQEIITDQTIDPRYARNLPGLGRVPDVVRFFRRSVRVRFLKKKNWKEF